jgi:hypothetical protein
MSIETISMRKILDCINAIWAKSFAAVIMFFIGMYVGQIQNESRIVSDCKFSGAFRSEIQAFNCQRRI